MNTKKNILINNLEKIKQDQNNLCFHAGTIKELGKIMSIGGRVLNFVCIADNFNEARKNAIDNIKILNWDKGFYRKDIGYKVID